MVTNVQKRARTRPNRFIASVQEFWQKRWADLIPPIIGIAAFLLVWQLLSSSGMTRLPGPLSLWTDQRTRELLLYPFYDMGGLDKGLFWQTLASLGRVAKGYTAAAVVGISLGVVVGTSPWLNKATYPIFQFLRMVAPLAWVPIALVALQQNQPAAIFVIFITAVWPILINTTEGVLQVPEDYNNVAKVLKLSRKDYYLNILFPAALPYIFTGLRIAIGSGLVGDYCGRKLLCLGLLVLAFSFGMLTSKTTSAKLFWQSFTSVEWVCCWTGPLHFYK
jgi:bicarbonate transport system permease protein